MSEVVDSLSVISLAVHFALVGQAKEYSENPQLLHDENWCGYLLWRLEELPIGEKIRKLSAPPRLKESHQHLVQATKHWDRATTLLTEGISEKNADKMSQGMNEVLLADEHLQQVTATRP